MTTPQGVHMDGQQQNSSPQDQQVIYITVPSGAPGSGIRLITSSSNPQQTTVQQQVILVTNPLENNSDSSPPFQQHRAWTMVQGRDDIPLNPYQNDNVQRGRFMTDQSTQTERTGQQLDNNDVHPRFVAFTGSLNAADGRTRNITPPTQQLGHHRFLILTGQSDDPASRPRTISATSQPQQYMFVASPATGAGLGPQPATLASQQQDPNAQPHRAVFTINVGGTGANLHPTGSPSQQQQRPQSTQLQQFALANVPPGNFYLPVSPTSQQQGRGIQQPQYRILVASPDLAGNLLQRISPTSQQPNTNVQFILVEDPLDDLPGRTQQAVSNQQQFHQQRMVTTAPGPTETTMYRVVSSSQHQSSNMLQQQLSSVTVMTGGTDPSMSDQYQHVFTQVEQYLVLGDPFDFEEYDD